MADISELLQYGIQAKTIDDLNRGVQELKSCIEVIEDDRRRKVSNFFTRSSISVTGQYIKVTPSLSKDLHWLMKTRLNPYAGSVNEAENVMEFTAPHLITVDKACEVDPNLSTESVFTGIFAIMFTHENGVGVGHLVPNLDEDAERLYLDEIFPEGYRGLTVISHET